MQAMKENLQLAEMHSLGKATRHTFVIEPIKLSEMVQIKAQ